MVITIDPADAAYWSLITHSLYQTTVNPRDHTESLNMAQIVPNENGTTTMVLSSVDPGVHNWLKASRRRPSQVVLLEELDKYLPEGTKRVTKAERALQLKERQRGWDRIRKF
ncbi:hypothetical protein BHE90_002941 [Fusarium euwallaceae]|uniref:DUF1214 domain-containing protein n=1 Tax=Fusarium euwallaceae TaxID=1147111 RepID=A0A430M3B7_9HYPO|nr:hypothetical protein BHE90_002941 [Fusarium euwallaceae]